MAEGVCVARGACMVGGGMHGEGVYMVGHA